MSLKRLAIEDIWGFRLNDIPLEANQPEFFVGWNPAHDHARARFREFPGNAYWARRVCETRDEFGDSRAMSAYATAVACVVSEDPTFATDTWYIGLANAIRLHGRETSVLKAVDRRVNIIARSTAHYVKGKLWVASMYQGRWPNLHEHGKRALSHLRKVDKDDRSVDWVDAVGVASAWSDYRSFRIDFGSYVGQCRNAFRLKQTFRVALSAASRNEDWSTFDEVRAWYREWYEKETDTDAEVDSATLAALDGWRALADKRMDGVQTSLGRLAALPKQWLEARRLISTLVSRKLLVDDCRKCLRAHSAAGMDAGRLPPSLKRLLL